VTRRRRRKFVELSKRLPAEDRRGDSMKRRFVELSKNLPAEDRSGDSMKRKKEREEKRREERSLDDEPYCKKNFIWRPQRRQCEGRRSENSANGVKECSRHQSVDHVSLVDRRSPNRALSLSDFERPAAHNVGPVSKIFLLIINSRVLPARLTRRTWKLRDPEHGSHVRLGHRRYHSTHGSFWRWRRESAEADFFGLWRR